MNHDQPRDYIKIKRNLYKATIWTFFEHFISYVLVLAICSFLYHLIEKTFSFSIGFIICTSTVLGLIRALILYSSGTTAIESGKLLEVLKPHM